MVKPTKFPELAINDTTLPTAGTDNKIEPPTAIKNTGWDQSQKPAAQHINYLFDLINDWLVYCDGEIDTLLTDVGDLTTGNGFNTQIVVYDNTYGAVSSIDLATIFSNNPSYRYFKIVVQDCVPTAGPSESLAMRVSIDGSTFRNTAGDYGWFHTQQDTISATTSDTNNNSDTEIVLGQGRLTQDVGDWVIKFNNPHNATAQTAITFEKEHATSTSKAIREFGVGSYQTTVDDITGFQLIWDGSNTFQAGTRIVILASNIPF